VASEETEVTEEVTSPRATVVVAEVSAVVSQTSIKAGTTTRVKTVVVKVSTVEVTVVVVVHPRCNTSKSPTMKDAETITAMASSSPLAQCLSPTCPPITPTSPCRTSSVMAA